MGLFSDSGDTSSSINLGTGGDYGSKLRSPSLELDLTGDSAASTIGSGSSLDLVGGDFERGLQMEQQKAQLMTQIHTINEVCWDTCVSSIGSSLGGRTESCLSNCVGRFVDTALFITQRYGQLVSKSMK